MYVTPVSSIGLQEFFFPGTPVPPSLYNAKPLLGGSTHPPNQTTNVSPPMLALLVDVFLRGCL